MGRSYRNNVDKVNNNQKKSSMKRQASKKRRQHGNLRLKEIVAQVSSSPLEILNEEFEDLYEE